MLRNIDELRTKTEELSNEFKNFIKDNSIIHRKKLYIYCNIIFSTLLDVHCSRNHLLLKVSRKNIDILDKELKEYSFQTFIESNLPLLRGIFLIKNKTLQSIERSKYIRCFNAKDIMYIDNNKKLLLLDCSGIDIILLDLNTNMETYTNVYYNNISNDILEDYLYKLNKSINKVELYLNAYKWAVEYINTIQLDLVDSYVERTVLALNSIQNKLSYNL